MGVVVVVVVVIGVVVVVVVVVIGVVVVVVVVVIGVVATVVVCRRRGCCYLRESEGLCFYRRWYVCLSVCLLPR